MGISIGENAITQVNNANDALMAFGNDRISLRRAGFNDAQIRKLMDLTYTLGVLTTGIINLISDLQNS